MEDGLAAHGQLRAILQLCTQHVPATGGGARARAQAGAAARAAGPGLAAQPARCTPGTCLDEELAGLPCAKCFLHCLKHFGKPLCRDAVEPSLPCVVNLVLVSTRRCMCSLAYLHENAGQVLGAVS